MTTPYYFLLLLLIPILSTNALPNPQPQQGAVDLRPSSITASPALKSSASYFTAIGSSEAAALSSEYAAFTSEEAVYATYTGPSDLFPSETLAPSEAALLSSEYAAFTSVYATYTGTGDPFANYTAIPFNKSAIPPSTTTTAQAPLRPGVRTSLAVAVAPTATAQWPALTRVNSSEVYGATCIQYYASGHMYNRTQCDTVVPQICDLLSASDAGTGDVDRWVYAYAPEQQTYGCVMGFWLPGAVRGTRKVPNGEACRNEVFGQMLNLCINAKGDELGLYNAASVNVGTLPGNGQAGTQVEAGAPSYIMALT